MTELERRVEILEWQVEMLLAKIGIIINDEESYIKMNQLLETMPKELKGK